jgi:hypothetical protein
MDAFASPSTRAETPGYGKMRILENVVATLAIALSLYNPLYRADSSLDASWQAMLIHAHSAGLQFGRDIIFTWGPWGFLNSLYHVGRLETGPILIWQVAGQLGIALALVTLTRALTLWRRAAFIVALLAFHGLFQDTVYFVLIALITIAALMKPGAPLLRLVAWTFLFGFLAQIKFTYFVLSGAAALAAIVCWVWRGSWSRACGIACGYILAVIAAWVAAGQSLGNLHAYIRRSLEISSGYADAMGFDESWLIFLWGSGIALICLIFVWRAWRTIPEPPFALCASAYLAFSLFVMWKESFIRADIVPLGGHVFGFFSYLLILGPVLSGLLFLDRRLHWFDSVPVLCLVGIASFDMDFYRLAPRNAWKRIGDNVASLERLGSLPDEWQRAYEASASAASLPAVRQAVGTGTVDVYNYSIGIALLNGLNVSARPVFQSYSAYTPALERQNLRFFHSARAPDFLLWREEGVDNRYPGQDDAMLVAALPGHYEAMFKEGEYWLLRKRIPVALEPLERRLVFERTVILGEETSLGSAGDLAVWLKADPVPNVLGRLRGILYNAPLINLAVTDEDGSQRVWRLVPRISREGFILVPTLATGDDLALLMKGEIRSRLRSFHFEAPAGQEKFWSRVEVSVFQLPQLPIRPVRGDR